jgi:hypothetical protein
LEEVWTHLSQLLTNRHENRHGIFPMLSSIFGGCGEQQFHDLLGTWLHLVETQKSGKSGVRGRSWCLEEVWTQLQLPTNSKSSNFPSLHPPNMDAGVGQMPCWCLISMNHQIDAAEWPSFNQKRHLRTSLGSPFFALTLPSLPQLQTGALLTRPQGIDDSLGFKTCF